MSPDTPAAPVPAALPILEADPKPWWQSRGVVGALLVIVSQVGAACGVQLDAGALTELAMQALGLLGAVLAMVGRIKAQQPIGRA